MLPDRWVLIVDEESGLLGGVALELVRLGIDTVYTKDLDEAALQARQDRERIGGLLLPAGMSVEQIERVVDRVGRHAGVDFSAIAVLGKRLEPVEREPLAKKGVRWCLWAPFDETGLRFVAKAAMWTDRDEDLRMELRVPTTLMANILSEEGRRRALVGDLTTSGAYLETPSPFPVGASLKMELELPGKPLRLGGEVRWVNKGGARAAGMGVEFGEGTGHESAQAIRQHLERELRRYSL